MKIANIGVFVVHKTLKDYDHIIWDWNGTLLSDIDIVLEIIEEILQAENLPMPSREEYRNIFCFPVVHYYQKLGFSPDTDFSRISHAFVHRYTNSYKERTSLFDGTKEMFETLKQAGKTFSILSAAEQNHLQEAVKHFGLDHYMSHIYGIDNIHGSSKISRGRDLITMLNHPREKIIMVGDTDHDYEVAQDLGIDALIIADGHQSFEKLQNVDCTVLKSRYHHV